MSLYLTSNIQATVIAVRNAIDQNCGLPNQYGTTTWAEVQKAVDQELYFISKPPADGWGNTAQHFTQAQMLNGIDLIGIVEMERQDSWFPAPPEIA